MRVLKRLYAYVLTFLTYFAMCSFVVTCCFLLFFSGIEIPSEQLPRAATGTLVNVIFLAVLMVVVDTVRRRMTVERRVRAIQCALQEITAGNFKVRLDTRGVQDAQFVEIMESINRMAEDLAGVETLRTDFIANVSHEMKTPLAVMQNYGTLLQTGGLTEEKRIEYAKAVTDGSRRLTQLMTNILKLNRLENQQIYPQAVVYDLGEQLCECLLQYENVWEQAEIGIETDIAEGITVRADSELLSLVWNNLLSNAFKFTPQGGTVSLRLTADGEYATVQVADTGCGMSPEIGAHIFEKFYQGDTSRATQGNGLGLALVRRVVDIMQGEIYVESTPGEGSTFTVRIRRSGL